MNDDDDFELDPDLDAALDAWTQDFERQAKAEATPMPQSSGVTSIPEAATTAPAPKSTATARPLYRPDPELIREREPLRRPTPAPQREDAFPLFDDDDLESTKVAAVPKELIASLQQIAAAREAQRALEGAPAPVQAAAEPSIDPETPPLVSIDLDLEDLFDGLEVDSLDAEPVDIEPANIEPADIEPADIEPADIEPADIEPADIEPADIEPADIEPANIEPANIEPADIEPADIERANIEPADIEPADIEPADIEPADIEPADRETGVTESPALVTHSTQVPQPPPVASARHQAPEEAAAEQSIVALETDFFDPFSDESASEPVSPPSVTADPEQILESVAAEAPAPARPDPEMPARPDPEMPSRPPTPAVPRPSAALLDPGLPPRRLADAPPSTPPATLAPATKPPAGDSDSTALAPPSVAAAPAPREPTSAPSADQGAATAQRTVRQRAPRSDRFAFVGRDVDTQRRRAGLLHALAARASGSARARLLTAAAELHEQLGDSDAARHAYTDAHAADPTDIVVLRALRREALRRRDFVEAAGHLAAEAALPLGAADRAHASSLLAELQLVHLADPAGAAESARRAHDEHPTATTALLLLEAQRALGDSDSVTATLLEAATVWPEGRAPLAAMAAASAEREGRAREARDAYERAAELTVTSGLGRTRLLDGSERAAGLAAVSHALQTASLREAFGRLAGVTRMREDPATTSDALRAATRPASLRARAWSARLASDLEARCLALESLARATGGTERATALIDLAEARAMRGELDAAGDAIRDAALADERLDTVRVVRELLSRRTADPERFAATDASTDDASAVALAARLAASDDRTKEHDALVLARERGESPLAVELVLLDAAAETGATEAVVGALRRHAERLPPERRAGLQLALASLVDGAPRLDALRAAAQNTPTSVTTRAFARAVSGPDAAEAWEREAAQTSGETCFHAWVQAGRAHLRAGDDDAARRAFERAFEERPGPSAAAWLLELRSPTERALLGERLLDVAAGTGAAAAAAARVAIDRGDAASLTLALEHVERALTMDPALDAWAVAHVGMAPAALSALSESRAAASENVTEKRQHLLRAAMAHERAGDARNAAAAQRAALALVPDPLASNAVNRIELTAGEQARVAERLFETVKSATTPEERRVALEALAALDLHEREDVSSGVLTLRSILDDAPGHLPTLRTLARYAMSHGDDQALEPVTSALAFHLPLPTGVATPELVAHARAAARLRLAPGDAIGDAADQLLRDVGARLRETSDDWLLRHLFAAADDDATRARWKARRAAHAQGDPYEQAAELLDAAEGAEITEGPSAAARLLAPTAELLPDDPITAERRGAWLRAAGAPAEAGVALQLAADGVQDPIHAVRLLYDAGAAFEEANDAGAAAEAFERASRLDIRYQDLFERLTRLLEARGDRARLAALITRRVAAGADTRTLVELHERRATLALELGSHADARAAFEAALGLDPLRVASLKRLATVQLEDSDWRGATESLIRIARLRQDRDELRWVFFTLGDIYDRHLPEPKRAEAAFRRVLKLFPDDLEALDRLASLFEREGQQMEAIPVIEELYAKEIDPDERHRHLLRLAGAHERSGDPRSAEHVLDEARKRSPTDLLVLEAMANLYRRQNAPAALAVHLGRATSDFRRRVEEDATSPEAWSGLVETLEWKDRRDAARACASVAVALGVQDIALGSRLDPSGGVPGGGTAAAASDLRDGVAPRMLNRTVFEVFRLAGEALDKAMPFDAKAWRAERLPSRATSLRDEALRAGRVFGFNDVQVLVSAASPRLCIAVGDRPATILVGHELATSTTEAERAFLFTRALAVAHAGLSVAMRSPPEAIKLLVGGLVVSVDPTATDAQLADTKVDPKALSDMAKRIGKHVPRKARDALVPLTLEMSGAPDFEPERLGLHAAELGARLALVASGAMPSALAALLALAGARLNEGMSSAQRVQVAQSVPEAWSLVRFAISDAYFDARHHAGADRL